MYKLFSLSIICVLFFSCKKNADTNNGSAGFLEIQVAGVSYTNNAMNTFSFENQKGTCSTKPYTISNISQIDVSGFFLDVYLKHYQNNNDFQSSTTGSFNVKENDILTHTACNLDIDVSFDDKTITNQATTLQAGSWTNTITSIKLLNQSTTDFIYTVAGTFSCSFKNSNNKIIPVTGKYQTTINVLK